MVGSRDLEPSQAPFYPTVFVNNQFKAKPQWPGKDKNLTGQTAIVTGSNAGLGYEAALQLLGLKLSHLIVAVRSVEKGQHATSQMRAKYPDARIDVWPLDLCSYDSIQTFAAKADSELARIDIMILNSGRFRFEYHRVDNTGHEEDLQAKRIPGHPPHVTIAGAALTLDTKFLQKDKVPLFAALSVPENFDADDCYKVSKVLGQMFLWKVVDYVSADDVIINIADPAFVRGTSLGRDLKGSLLYKILFPVFGYIAGRAPRVGASCFIDAVVNKGKESHGCFLMSWKPHPFPTLMYTAEGRTLIERVWEETLAEFEFAGARKKIESMRA